MVFLIGGSKRKALTGKIKKLFRSSSPTVPATSPSAKPAVLPGDSLTIPGVDPVILGALSVGGNTVTSGTDPAAAKLAVGGTRASGVTVPVMNPVTSGTSAVANNTVAPGANTTATKPTTGRNSVTSRPNAQSADSTPTANTAIPIPIANPVVPVENPAVSGISAVAGSPLNAPSAGMAGSSTVVPTTIGVISTASLAAGNSAASAANIVALGVPAVTGGVVTSGAIAQAPSSTSLGQSTLAVVRKITTPKTNFVTTSPVPATSPVLTTNPVPAASLVSTTNLAVSSATLM